MKPTRNVPASVRQRLLNHAKNDKRPFNELLYYAMERFLYCLSRSIHADCFILKGALSKLNKRFFNSNVIITISVTKIVSQKRDEL